MIVTEINVVSNETPPDPMSVITTSYGLFKLSNLLTEFTVRIPVEDEIVIKLGSGYPPVKAAENTRMEEGQASTVIKGYDPSYAEAPVV